MTNITDLQKEVITLNGQTLNVYFNSGAAGIELHEIKDNRTGRHVDVGFNDQQRIIRKISGRFV